MVVLRRLFLPAFPPSFFYFFFFKKMRYMSPIYEGDNSLGHCNHGNGPPCALTGMKIMKTVESIRNSREMSSGVMEILGDLLDLRICGKQLWVYILAQVCTEWRNRVFKIILVNTFSTHKKIIIKCQVSMKLSGQDQISINKLIIQDKKERSFKNRQNFNTAF